MATQLTAFIGTIIGVALGNVDAAQPYLLALTAGMFLYLGLVDLVRSEHTCLTLQLTTRLQLPELAHNFKDSYVLLAVKHLGLLLGVGLTVLFLWAEEQFAD